MNGDEERWQVMWPGFTDNRRQLGYLQGSRWADPRGCCRGGIYRHRGNHFVPKVGNMEACLKAVFIWFDR